MAPATSACLTENFTQQWPDVVARLQGLHFIEQYDPEDLTVKDSPYAYVCDQVREIKLGIDIDEAREVDISDVQSAAIAELRDKLTPDAKIGWFVVVNGDVDRWAPPLEDEDELADEDDEEAETRTLSPPARSPRSSVWTGSDATGQEPARPSTSRSMKKWIGGMLRKTRSSKSLRGEATQTNPTPPVPPLPPMSPKAALSPPRTANGKAAMPLRPAH
jgi:hypothetical protein